MLTSGRALALVCGLGLLAQVLPARADEVIGHPGDGKFKNRLPFLIYEVFFGVHRIVRSRFDGTSGFHVEVDTS